MTRFHAFDRRSQNLSRLLTVTVSAAIATLAAALPSGHARADDDAVPLPKLEADIRQTTTSGISSGAYMAGQFQFAHGEHVIGAAIVAGGPYGCAESAFSGLAFGPAATILNFNRAVTGCMMGNLRSIGVPNAARLAARARNRAEDRRIAPIPRIRDDRVYLFTGTNDRTVVPFIVRETAEFYARLGLPQTAIKLVDRVPAGHAFVTEDEGGRCDTSLPPYVVDCDFDLAADLLTHLYGALNPPGEIGDGRYVTFDQTDMTRGLFGHGLARAGVAYVPDACRTAAGCRVHIAFHGCGQNRETVRDTFIGRTGFARWAVTNRLIVLFPQVATSFTNTQACWDWWGYTGSAFLTRGGKQIQAVKRMLTRLGEAD